MTGRWEHVPESLLATFLEGELEGAALVQVIDHVDGCSLCANRAAALEPLTAAFASTDDAPVPPDLAGQVLAAVESGPAPAAVRPVEPGVAAGLAVAAMAVLVLLGAPGELIAGIGVVLDVAGSVVRAVEVPVALLTPIWLAAAVVTFAAAAVTARRLDRGAGDGTLTWR